jgi:VCBS repeat-containing protein
MAFRTIDFSNNITDGDGSDGVIVADGVRFSIASSVGYTFNLTGGQLNFSESAGGTQFVMTVTMTSGATFVVHDFHAHYNGSPTSEGIWAAPLFIQANNLNVSMFDASFGAGDLQYAAAGGVDSLASSSMTFMDGKYDSTNPASGNPQSTFWLDNLVIQENAPPANTAPTANADSKSVKEDTAPNPVSANVLANDSDVNGDTLSVTNAGTFVLTHGSLVLHTDGSYDYTLDNANPDVNGLGNGGVRTDTFNYSVSDGHGGTASATLTITINGTNDAPVINSISAPATGIAGMPVSFGSNVTDPEGAALTYSWNFGDGTPAGNLPAPTHTYGATGNYTVTLTASDPDGATSTTALAISIENHAPTAVAGGPYNIQAGNGVTLDASGSSDIDGQALSYSWDLNNDGIYGDATGVNLTLSWAQLQALGKTGGSYGIQLQVSDGFGGVATTLTTLNVNNPPTANGDNASIAEDAAPGTVSGNVVTNDSDANGDTLSVTNAGTFMLPHGSLVLHADGSYDYTLDNANTAVNALKAGQSLTDSFTYAVSDGHGGATSAQLDIKINGANDAPVLGGDNAITVAEGGLIAITKNDLTATDVDNTDAQLVYTVTATSHGSVLVNGSAATAFTQDDIANGRVMFRHDGGEANGGFSVALSDGTAAGITANVAATVDPHVNDAPVLHDVPAAAAYANGPAVILAPGLTISDVDSATLASATVHVGAGVFTAHGDVLSVSAADLAGTSIVANYNAASETLTLSGTDTLAHYTQVLEHVRFQTTNFANDHAQTLEWQVNDGSAANNLSDLATTDISLHRPQNNDFSGNGHGGILWQNTDGTPAVWTVDGTSLVSGANAGASPGPSWHVIGSGDFNADGKSDILWQNTDGTIAEWFMNGSSLISGASVAFNPGPAWHAIGTGDFNGDGKADILWQNADGTPAVWLMDGLNIQHGANVGFNPGAAWHVIGAGDFDGDGKADILWQNTNGQAAVWLMDGQTLKAGADVGFNPGADWHVQGAGDFNGDGKADILWQNTNGQAAIWEMNGLNLISGSNVGFNPGPAWQVHGAGDFNGDGKSDIVWQNTDGTPAVWLMDGLNLVAGSNVGFDPGSNWHVVPPHHDLLV